jgi:hypothetical protein
MTDQPARVEMCANRFELITPWGQPVDKEWAMRQFAKWLNNRLDLTRPSVYDSGVQAKGTDHG